MAPLVTQLQTSWKDAYTNSYFGIHKQASKDNPLRYLLRVLYDNDPDPKQHENM